MAMKGLYPPIINTYMPAFRQWSESDGAYLSYKIDYKIPLLNSSSDIKYVQMSVVNQNTNRTILNTTTYPNGIKMMTPNNVFLTVGNNADVVGNLVAGQYYKVQLRFVSSSVPTEPTFISNPDARWLTDNLDYFSEWSTVCLITCIDEPEITLNSFSISPNNSSICDVDCSNNITVSATFSSSFDYLKECEVILTDINGNVIEKSNKIYSSNILHSFNTEIKDSKEYKIIIKYITKKLYEGSVYFSFRAHIKEENVKIYGNINSYVNQDEDQIIVKCDLKEDNRFPNAILILKRTDHTSGFSKWNEVHRVAISKIGGGNATYFWGDCSVESGIWYQYALCFEFTRVANGQQQLATSNMKKEENPSMIILSGMSLLSGGRLLKIPYNPSVSVNKKSSSNITETIGGKYPIIRHNANLDYKQLSISGLITKHMDSEELFVTNKDLYKNNENLYNSYNNANSINAYNDITAEFLFREEVLKFLTDGEPKLFRSPTEGNILVQLTDISLQPMEQLTRMLYTFTATATEIGEATLENYNKYDIQNIENASYEVASAKYISNPDGTITLEVSQNDSSIAGGDSTIENDNTEYSNASFSSSILINGGGDYVLILNQKMG